VTAVVPLIRRFEPISRHYQDHDVALDDIWSMMGRGSRVAWNELGSAFRAVFLADAGAGKTYELKAEATRMVDRGLAAFFIRIEDIDEKFGDAFEVGSEETFKRWLDGAEDEAWFFLDSVDEVRLETPRAFENALRAFASRVRDARHRAHVFISSRPYAWRSKLDRDLINELLPYAPPREEPADEDDAQPTAAAGDEEAEGLKLFKLAPLDDDDIRIFAGHRGVSDVGTFLEAIKRTNLFDQARRPFDLEDLLATWREIGSLESRLGALERGLHRRLTPPERRPGLLSFGRAQSGARRLALAATLMSESDIGLPGSAGGGLEAAALLDDWTDAEVTELLNRGVFSDPIYATVRFRHRESRELLAAQQLAEWLRRPNARETVEGLIFKDTYGELVIVPRLRPLLPWLILFDEGVRTRALTLDASIGFEGGDPSRLPFEVRKTLLHSVVKQIANREISNADNSQIARIAQGDLAEETLTLIEAYRDQEDVIFFLGRLVWQGEMTAPAESLAPIALDPGRDIYSRIVAARAVFSVLGAEAGHSLWGRLNAGEVSLPRRLLAELIDVTIADDRSVAELVVSLGRSEAFERYDGTGLGVALQAFIDRLPLTNDRAPGQPLVRLVEGLADLLAREPFVERGECKVSEAFAWLMPAALHAVERLVIGRSSACLGASAMAVLNNAPALRHWRGEDFDGSKSRVGELVPRWEELNDALFWHSVESARAALEAKGEALTEEWTLRWLGPFWRFDGSSFKRTLSWVTDRTHPDDRSVALTCAFRSYVTDGRVPAQRRALWRAVRGDKALEARLSLLMRPPPSPSVKRWRDQDRKWTRQRHKREAVNARGRQDFVARLKDNPDQIRTPPCLSPGEISREQLILLQSIEGDGARLTRHAGAHWASLIPEFGEAVAQAFRDGALQQWRSYRPQLRSEGVDGNGIPYALIYGMVGLEIEAGEDGRGLEALTADDARHALRYAVWELNGFPIWFESLYRAHPQIGFDLIWGELRSVLARAAPDQPMHNMLHDLVYHAPWLHSVFAEPIWSWLNEHGAPNHDTLQYGRTIMVGGGLSAAKLASLAAARLADGATLASQRPSWFALWVDADADAAIPVLEVELAAMAKEPATRFAEQFAVNLVGGRRNPVEKLATWRTPPHLKTLYVLLHRYIRVEDDLDRANGGVYSPTIRDDAQDARDHLFGLLADMPGEDTFQAINALAVEHPQEKYRAYMRRRAHDRAVADSEPLWSFEAVRDLDARLAGRSAH
jgi:hypothetical protein